MLNLKSDTEHKIEILLLDNQGITVFDFFKKNGRNLFRKVCSNGEKRK